MGKRKTETDERMEVSPTMGTDREGSADHVWYGKNKDKNEREQENYSCNLIRTDDPLEFIENYTIPWCHSLNFRRPENNV